MSGLTRPWLNRSLGVDTRTALLLAAMTVEEKVRTYSLVRISPSSSVH